MKDHVEVVEFLQNFESRYDKPLINPLACVEALAMRELFEFIYEHPLPSKKKEGNNE